MIVINDAECMYSHCSDMCIRAVDEDFGECYLYENITLEILTQTESEEQRTASFFLEALCRASTS